MMRQFLKVLAVSSFVLLMTIQAHAENYAFLVAVQDYNVKSLKPLRFTRNDIEAFSKVLQASGFKSENIVLMTDEPKQLRYAADAERIRKQFDTLLAGLEEKDTLVVAFAGHGVQFEGDAKNYFCPADADLEDPKHSKLIPISELYEKLKVCPASRKLLVVDACRKEPQTDLARSRDTVKLKSVTRPQSEPVPKGVVALFSCSAGQEAFEWPELKHGIFFHHFLEGWEGAAAQGEQQVTLEQVVAYAKLKTQTFARLKLDTPQTPQVKSEFEGIWVLKKLPSSDTSRPALPANRTNTPLANPGTPENSPKSKGNLLERDRNKDSKMPVNPDDSMLDVAITAKVRKQIVAKMSVNAQKVRIITQDGKVMLRGSVKSAEDRRKIEDIAREIAGPRKVDNQIQVEETAVP